MLCFTVARCLILMKKICDLVCVNFHEYNLAWCMCQMLLYPQVHIFCNIYCVVVADIVDIMVNLYNIMLNGFP